MKNNFRFTTIILVTVASLFLVADARAVILTYENNEPLDIPDTSTVTSELTLAFSRIITDLNVELNIDHTYVGDLDISLIAPDGTQIELFSDMDSCKDNLENTVLDDEAETSIIKNGDAPYTGSFKPEGSLATFDGMDAKGTWQLVITDDTKWDSGILQSWSLIIDAVPKFILVSEWNKTVDDPNVVCDQGWIDLLEAQGYMVDANTEGNYIDLDDSKIAALEEADLILISRNSNSGNYAGDVNEITAWNSVSTPIIMMTAYISRSNRWQWIDSTSIVEYAPETLMEIVNVAHPIFDGVTTEVVDSMSLVDVIDETVDLGENSFITATDVGNGSLLARRMDDGSIWIAEWKAGVACYEGATQVPAGKRMLFSAGGGGGQNAGSMNLNEEGQKMFLNAVAYMLTVPVDPGADGLVAYYEMNCNADDSSGNELHGTLMGDPGFVDAGMVLDLDGDGDYVDCGYDPLFDVTTNEITVSAWVTIRSISNQWAAIAAKGEYAWRLGNASWDPRFHFGITIWNAPDTASRDGIAAVGYDEWHHVAGMFDGSNIMIFIDGILDASAATTEPIGVNDKSMFIGDNPDATGRYWDGLVDELKIYDRALSYAEILFLASSPRPEPTAIEVENFSFELPGTEKIKGWNGEGVSDTPAEDIPGWASDTEVGDSGVESDWPGSTEGVWSGFIMGTDPSVWNLTDYVIGAGDYIELLVDLQDNWSESGAPLVTISLYYDEAGVRVPVASTTVTPPDQSEGGWTEYSLTFAADDVPESIGKQLGIEIDNVSEDAGGSWVGMENVRLLLAAK